MNNYKLPDEQDEVWNEQLGQWELIQVEIIKIDLTEYERKMEELDREIIATCKTVVYVNFDLPIDRQYRPTDRERLYVKTLKEVK